MKPIRVEYLPVGSGNIRRRGILVNVVFNPLINNIMGILIVRDSEQKIVFAKVDMNFVYPLVSELDSSDRTFIY